MDPLMELDGSQSDSDLWESVKTRIFANFTIWEIIMSKVETQQQDNPIKRLRRLFEEVECVLAFFQVEVESQCTIMTNGQHSMEDIKGIIPDKNVCKFLGISPLTSMIYLSGKGVHQMIDCKPLINHEVGFQDDDETEGTMECYPETDGDTNGTYGEYPLVVKIEKPDSHMAKYCQPDSRKYQPADPIPYDDYIKMTTGEAPKQCPDCGSYFRAIFVLIRHMKTRKGCRKTELQKDKVDAPEGLVFSIDEPKTGKTMYGCTYEGCHDMSQRLWNKKSKVHAHYSKEHMDASKLPLKCNLCDKRFLTTVLLNSHHGQHIKSRNHQPVTMDAGVDPALGFYCKPVARKKNEVLSSFSPDFPITEEDFNRMVEGQIPKQCSQCRKYFNRMTALVSHLKTECEVKNEGLEELVFSNSDSGAGQKLYGCNFPGCHESNELVFASAQMALDHISTEHPDIKTESKCHLCESEFVTTSLLTMHLNEKHHDEPASMLDNEETSGKKMFVPMEVKPEGSSSHPKELEKYCEAETTRILFRPSYPFTEEEFGKMFYGETPKQCPTCKEYFVRMMVLIKHLKQSKECGANLYEPEGLHFCIIDPITKEKKYGCAFEDCHDRSNRLWTSRLSVHRHYALAHKEVCQFDFKCPVCPEEFLTMALLTNHLHIHKGDLSLKQKERNNEQVVVKAEGDKSEAKPSMLDIILQRKLTKKRYQHRKKEWNESFISLGLDKDTFDKMKRGEMTRECPKCKKTLASQFFFYAHLERNQCVWVDKKVEPIPKDNFSFSCPDETGRMKFYCAFVNCPDYGKTWNKRHGVMNHWQTRHSDCITPTVACPHCEKKFLSKALLRDHTKYAHAETLGKSFICTICAKECKNQRQLRAHEVSHTADPRAFSCDFCDYKCRNQHTKNTHMKAMHPEKFEGDATPFKCEHCGKEFRWENSFKKHVEIAHTDYIPDSRFQCKICGKQLKQNNSYRKHMVNCHGMGERCDLCDKLCLDKEGLDYHKRKFHDKS